MDVPDKKKLQDHLTSFTMVPQTHIGIRFNLTTLLRITVAGVIAAPVYVNGAPVIVTVVTEAALSIVKFLVSLLVSWLASLA